MINFADMTVEQKAQYFDTLVARGDVNPARFLADFSTTLASVIEEELEGLEEPTFPHPITGEPSASLFAIINVLDIGYIGDGAAWRRMVRLRSDFGARAVEART